MADRWHMKHSVGFIYGKFLKRKVRHCLNMICV